MTEHYKAELKRQVAECLAPALEIRKIVVFGSFLSEESPNDMDIAVFLDGGHTYLPAALKYRKMAKPVSEQIPVDIIPVRPNASGRFLDEINRGEVIYER